MMLQNRLHSKPQKNVSRPKHGLIIYERGKVFVVPDPTGGKRSRKRKFVGIWRWYSYVNEGNNFLLNLSATAAV
jgi:hypothetical protein